MAIVEQMGTGIMVDTAKAVSFEDTIKCNPTWVAWLGVRELLTPYGVFPYRNGKGSYALYVWDRECKELSDFWHSTKVEDRKACGLTAHSKDGVLLIYEMGFAIKPRQKRTVKKSSLDRPMSPAVKAELDRRARLEETSKMSFPRLIFEVLIGKKIKKMKTWLINQAL